MGDSAHKPTIQTREKNQHPPFFSNMRTFFKNRPPWFYIVGGIAVELEPRRPIFEKIFSSSRKRGGADAFENDPSFRSKGTVCMLLL
jgi:hypothetical protein